MFAKYMGSEPKPLFDRKISNDLITRHATNGWRNRKDFATFLHDLEPSRTQHAWECAISRWVIKDSTNKVVYLQDEELHIKLPVSTAKTWYDGSKDVYLTFLKVATTILKVKGTKHRMMKKAYSNQFNTTGSEQMSIKDMAIEFEMPVAWMQEYVRNNKWSHAMSIFTDEEISELDEDALEQLAFEEKKKSIDFLLKRKMRRKVENDAMKMQQLDVTLLNEFRELVSTTKITIPRKKRLPKDSNLSVVISPTDLHYGKYGWEDEVGETYTMDEAKHRLMDRTQNLIDRLPAIPERIFVTAGSDWFHVDNEDGTTTQGTAQDRDGSPAKILMGGCRLAREHIDMLAGIAPVTVVFMRGNHDRHTSLALMMYLDAVYENTEQVTVINSPKLRQYIQWGNNLLGFTHGDGAKSIDLPALMSTEAREQWAESRHHTWFHGHLHHIKTTEKHDCMIIQLPSLAGHDRWHYRKGYVMARPGIYAHLLDKDLGVVGNIFAPVV